MYGDFSIPKHEGKNAPADLMLEVSKLFNNVGSTATPFTIWVQAMYTNDEVTKLVVMDSKKSHITT